MTTLGEAAQWHDMMAAALRSAAVKLLEMGVLNHRADQIAMHERFAVAIREADGAEPTEAKP